MLSPYRNSTPPMCYPGTLVPEDIAEIAKKTMIEQANLIGTHTHSDVGEGGFEYHQQVERDVVFKIASLYTSQ